MNPVGIRRYPPIPLLPGVASCPLTFQQERVLYFCELDPHSSIWDINTCKRIGGALDAGCLRQAVERLAAGHQVLRTRIYKGAEGPQQAFDQDTRKGFRHIDLSAKAKGDADRRLAASITRICQEPISHWTYDDLLFEVVLLTLATDDHALLLRVHHIISDAASVEILWRDLVTFYNTLAGGEPVPPPERRLSYSDYALWQRQHFSAEQTREQERYWLGEFHDEVPALDLPTDYLPSPGLSFRGGLVIVDVPLDLITAFQALSWTRKVLLFSSLFAAYFVLLQKFCQQEDITVGALFSGRHYQLELNEMTGFFVNTTAVRVDVDRDARFEELVDAVHRKVEMAYHMQDYPFERLIQQLAPRRGEGRIPLVRTMFNVVGNPAEATAFSGSTDERWIDVATQTNAVQSDLIFDLHYGSQGAEIRIEHNTDLFETATVMRLADHYVTLLRQLASGWQVSLGSLELVDAEHRRRLVRDWNPGPTPYADDRCIHDLFEEQAARHPDAPALFGGPGGGRMLSYGELNRSANRLAAALRRRGLGPEKLVAVVGDRSPDMVMGQLGILKAGGAYLPIAKSSPPRRIDELLGDASPCALVLPDDYREGLAFDGPVLRLGDREVREAEDTDPVHLTGPGNLAYVIYTSGSTGSPKGVMVSHRSVVNLATSVDYMELRPDDRILQTGAPAFDATTFEIWGALLNGLRLYEVSDEVLLDAGALGGFLAAHRISVMFLIPPLFNELVEADPGLFAPLRYLISGGDVLSTQHVETAAAANPGLTLINAYGPTENTTFSTCYPIVETARTKIPIGRPIPNSSVHVFDRESALSPVGAIGELHVGGHSLARGYLGQPSLTAERFVPNPFEDGERLYKTGDLVRWRPDGTVEFIGRGDRQVKIRGFRIELGEIENRLLQHPAVRHSSVAPLVDDDGGKSLCAYYVAEPEVTDADLRHHLSGLLPSYMVPARFVRLDRMPLTDSGKIDRKALPTPERPEAEGERDAPRDGELGSAEELRVARIWEELLEKPCIGAHDNFFEIGGHSLKATALASRLSQEFGVKVSPRTVFDAPTVAELALLVGDGGAEEEGDGLAG